MFADLHVIRAFIDFLVFVAVGCHAYFTILDRRSRVTQGVLTNLRSELLSEVSALRRDLETRRKKVDDHLDALKNRVADAPTRDDIVRLHNVIHEHAQISSELRGAVRAVQNTVQMINQHLLERGNG